MHVFKRFYIHRLFALALCLGQTIFIHAQMTNGGFEQNSSLPSALGQFFKAQGWGNANSSVGSPDYFHYAGNNATDLPETPMALVNSFSGSAAMGMIVCGRNGMNIREYLTYTFPTPMVPGQKYVVRFNVTNGDRTSVSNAGLGVDQIGIYFADAPVNQNGYDPIIATPDYRIEEVFYSKVWKSYSFVYEATSAKQQLVFGLFGADADKNIVIKEGTDPNCAYVFVDDFRIIPVPDGYDPIEEQPDRNDHNDDPNANLDITSNEPWFIPNSFTPSDGNTVNDVFKPVANRVVQWHFCVFNLWGEQLFATNDPNEGWDGTFQGKVCESGSYIWRVEYLEPLADNPRSTIIRQGTFTLLR
jgi:gliding motility-associated-like protein